MHTYDHFMNYHIRQLILSTVFLVSLPLFLLPLEMPVRLSLVVIGYFSVNFLLRFKTAVTFSLNISDVLNHTLVVDGTRYQYHSGPRIYLAIALVLSCGLLLFDFFALFMGYAISPLFILFLHYLCFFFLIESADNYYYVQEVLTYIENQKS